MNNRSILLEDKHSAQIALWCLRILVYLGGHKRFVRATGYDDFDILNAVGLSHMEEQKITPSKARKLLRNRLRKIEKMNPGIRGRMAKNLKRLSKALSFSKVEQKVLGFAVLLHSSDGLSEACYTLGYSLDSASLTRALAVLLGYPKREMQLALQAKGALASSGVLRLDHHSTSSLPRKLRLLDGLADALFRERKDPVDLLRSYFRPAPRPKLKLQAFSYLRENISLLRCYLAGIVGKDTTGVNILVYGEPGTGKTELVRALACEANQTLYEISMEQQDGTALCGDHRFSAYQLSQRILAHRQHCLILFDEIEDVFPTQPWFGDGQSRPKKAWVNRLLEQNLVPAFWVSNQVTQMDRAYLRRFDFVLKLRVPTQKARHRILQQHVNGLPVRSEWITRMAAQRDLVPAHIERAAKVMTTIGSQGSEKIEDGLERLLGNTLEVLGLPPKGIGASGGLQQYRLDVLNPDRDLASVVRGLQTSAKGRLCLYGPPGSGKTAFANHLSEILDKPLVARRASELLSKWVGETEQALAAMFQEAVAEDAVLLLDEADSFLRDRGGAQHSWELTQVNELLVQMEAFDGLFIAATNWLKILDSASLRRFDLKIHFRYLRPQQAWVLFQQTLQQLGLEPKTGEALRHRLAPLDRLTPGDFATVLRQGRLLGESSAEKLVTSLELECRAKPDATRQIGFVV